MLDITALCRAYVDLIVPVSFSDLKALGYLPGQDMLISKDDIARLSEQFADKGEVLAGGPGANLISGVQALGGKTAFIGKMSDDNFGQFFQADLKQRGIIFDCAIIPDDVTASCVIFVTPNGMRTILYNPTISDDVTLDDIERNKRRLQNSKLFYMGWLNREQHCKEIIDATLALIKDAKRVSSLQSYGGRVNDDFSAIANADIILGNDNEYDLFLDDMKLDSLKDLSAAYPDKTFACTQGEKGALIYHQRDSLAVPAVKPTQLIDTTGAGDAWASGFLYGIAQNQSLEKAGLLGAQCAAEIITHTGGRPQKGGTHLNRQLNV